MEKRNRPRNNFDFLRILAATAIILSHSYALVGKPEPLFLGRTFGDWGVNIFFIISGYLLAGTDDFSIRYFWKRGLRLLPALSASVIVTIFVIGPMVTELSISNYFQDPATWAFLSRILIFFGVDRIPGVFEDNPFPNAVNGSIWMLPYLVVMYVILYIYGYYKLLKNKLVMIYMLLIAYAMIPPDVNSFVGIISTWYFWHWYLYFFIGSLLYIYKNILNFGIQTTIFSLLLYIYSLYFDYFETIHYIAYPIIIISISLIKSDIFNNVGKYGDFSYGMFVFAWPIQQTIVHFWHSINAPQMFFLSWFISLSVAIASWNLIERYAGKLKDIKL